MAVSSKPLSQQVLVITGASSGIGPSTAEAMPEPGAKLVLAARSVDRLREPYGRGENGHTRGSDPASPGAAPSNNVR